MLKKYCLLLAVILLIALTTSAQTRILNGYLKDSITLLPIANGTVMNESSKTSIVSDRRGFFRLPVKPNDFIYAYGKSYNYDTLSYSYLTQDTVTIFLSFAGNILPAVTVKGQYSKYQLDSMQRREDFDKGRPVAKTFSTSHPSGFGLTLNLDKLLQKKYRYQKRDEQLFSTLEKMAYVDYRYSPHVVNYYTGLKGDELQNFMKLYTPSYEWLRQHTANEDVLYYINDKLKAYHKNQKTPQKSSK
jgi:hypothetical protein